MNEVRMRQKVLRAIRSRLNTDMTTRNDSSEDVPLELSSTVLQYELNGYSKPNNSE